MTTEEIQAVLDAVAMPGWEWQIKHIYYGHLLHGSLLRGGFERPDRETGAQGTGYSRWEFLGEDCTNDGIIKTCWVLVKLTIEHEAMEFFSYGGKRVFDPHIPVDQLTSLQDVGA